MKGFIVSLIAITVAGTATFAAPQYNYAQPAGHNSLSTGGGFSGSHSGGFIGSGGFSSGGVNGGYSGNAIAGGYASGAEQHAIVTKQFFIHSAPEEAEERGADKVISLGPAHKHYRVVFIKAPHQGVQNGRIRLIAPAHEEKTAIYVLSKKTDASDIQADVQQAHSEPSKPEVHFIKYKTHEEAAHAQRTIQAQYDAIQGTSQILDEGVAPLTSVIGALGDNGGHSGGGAGGHFSGAGGHFGGAGGNAGGHFGGAGGFGGSGAGGSSFGSNTNAYLPPSH